MSPETFATEAMAMERTLYGVARSYLSSTADCCDAVQQALLRAWEKRGTLRNERYFRTWLTRILINECRTLLRRGKRMIPVAEVPERAAEMVEGRNELLPLLQELPEKYRLPLVLYHLEGYSVKEAARCLQLPCGTLTSRLKRGRALLKQNWKEEIDNEMES